MYWIYLWRGSHCAPLPPHAPLRSKISQFHVVFWKIWQNHMLYSMEGWRPLLREILDLPLEAFQLWLWLVLTSHEEDGGQRQLCVCFDVFPNDVISVYYSSKVYPHIKNWRHTTSNFLCFRTEDFTWDAIISCSASSSAVIFSNGVNSLLAPGIVVVHAGLTLS